jgi:hypothetical protein
MSSPTHKKMKLDEDKVLENEEKSENSSDLIHCQFWVKRKSRFCKMKVKEGNKYCGEHKEITNDNKEPVNEKRVICPLNPKVKNIII